MKNQVVFLSCLGVLGIILGIGAYSLSKKPEKNLMIDEFNKNAIDIYNPENQEEVGDEFKETYYLLKKEDDFLVLYSGYGEECLEIKRVGFRPELFPKEDIHLLNDGIKVYSYEEGIAVIEDFVS